LRAGRFTSHCSNTPIPIPSLWTGDPRTDDRGWFQRSFHPEQRVPHSFSVVGPPARPWPDTPSSSFRTDHRKNRRCEASSAGRRMARPGGTVWLRQRVLRRLRLLRSLLWGLEGASCVSEVTVETFLAASYSRSFSRSLLRAGGGEAGMHLGYVQTDAMVDSAGSSLEFGATAASRWKEKAAKSFLATWNWD
jgi:hypothetical protein